MRTLVDVAVIGAGPTGLALALLGARTLPHARFTLFDARPAAQDGWGDPRTLALSMGSLQLLRRLGVWPGIRAQAIVEVHVSQAPPSVALPGGGAAAVHIRASAEGMPQLGAVLRYGDLLAPLQQAWQVAVAAEPGRLRTRFGTPVTALVERPGGVEVDAGVVEGFDLAVVAEGGIFAEQARKAVARDYGQTAWVGTATLGRPHGGVAYERFTPHGPLALLPLPVEEGQEPLAALVWCVPTDGDPVRDLSDSQRLALLGHLLPREAGPVTRVSPLKSFALGLNAERSLVQGRQVRIGNAAQTLHPVAGQGLNLGLRDVHVLVHALRHAEDIDQALRRVEWSRGPDRWATIAATDALARIFTWQGPGLGTLRGLGLAALQAAPPLRSWLARQMMFGIR
jgi:2-octaprenyl-6-methoxyphenol hydroxylase